MSDAELEEKRRVAKEALLAVARLTPVKMRYVESSEALPGEVRELLSGSLQQLIGGKRLLVELDGEIEKLKYIPFQAWEQWEQAKQRLEILKDVYPELQLSVEMYRGYAGKKWLFCIWWSEELLQLNYMQQLETPDGPADVS